MIDNSKIADIVTGIDGVKSVHKIRTRGRRDDVYVDLHVIVDGMTPIKNAHKLSHKIQAVLKDRIEGISDVVVHMEPME